MIRLLRISSSVALVVPSVSLFFSSSISLLLISSTIISSSSCGICTMGCGGFCSFLCTFGVWDVFFSTDLMMSSIFLSSSVSTSISLSLDDEEDDDEEDDDDDDDMTIPRSFLWRAVLVS